MDYPEALRYLDSFIDYEKIGYDRKRTFNLERMRRLAEIFGNPQEGFHSIHITGTKGKGSIASFASSILKEANFSVGLYTSPHITDPRERIMYKGDMIEKEDLAFHAGLIKEKLAQGRLDFSPTFFEIYTILAFNYFKARKVDFAILEVGLGGRLDATNIVSGLVSGISSISYDHTDVLGDDLRSIALEKSGIIKPGSPCVSAPQENEALGVIERRSRALNSELILVGRDMSFKELRHNETEEVFNIRGILGDYGPCVSRLVGRHQITNAVCATGIIECLIKRGVKVSHETVKRGIEKTKNPSRCEVISKRPYIVFDAAQNRASAGALADTLKRNFKYKRLFVVLGMSKKKDIKGLCEELMPLADTVFLTKANMERAEDPNSMKRFVAARKAVPKNSVRDAFLSAAALARPEDMVLVTGSFFVIKEAREAQLEKERSYI